jgi:hypothetical protein
LRIALDQVPSSEAVPKALRFGLGYVGAVYRTLGKNWIDRAIVLPGIDWNVNMFVNLAWGLPAEGHTWDRLETWGEEVTAAYWARVPIDIISPDNAMRDAERAVRKLLGASRFHRALHVAAMCFPLKKRPDGQSDQPISVELIIKLLREVPRHDPKSEWWPPPRDMLSHHVQELLDVLESCSVALSIRAELEWVWLPALDRHDRGPKALQKAIAEDPALFVRLLELAFRAEDYESSDTSASANSSEDDQARAMHAYQLLEAWDTLPGLREQKDAAKAPEGAISFGTGQLDESQLLAWVKKARELSVTSKRLDICDSQIGEMLAKSPADADGTWPCEAVRNVLEDLKSEKLERGLMIGIHNRRGAHFRRAGGDQERNLANTFRGFEQRVQSRWPRTASVLGAIVREYEREAKREDDRAAFEEFE